MYFLNRGRVEIIGGDGVTILTELGEGAYFGIDHRIIEGLMKYRDLLNQTFHFIFVQLLTFSVQ